MTQCSTVFEKDLKIHLEKRCNSRPRGLPVSHSLNINCTLPLSLEELEFQKNIYSHQKMHVQPWLARVQLKSLTREQLNSVYDKINAVELEPIPTEISSHVAVEQKRYEYIFVLSFFLKKKVFKSIVYL